MPLLEGKVAIVTGAGHGIGRGHAMELAKHGASVVVNDLGGSEHGEGSGSAAEDTVKLITDRGGVAVPNFADVSDFDKSGEMVQQAIDEFGKLDILVNNAGIVRDAAIWNMKVEDWDAVMRVHVRGTWCPTHHASKHWRERAKEGPAEGADRQHHVGRGSGRQLRPDELRDRQGGHRRHDAHARPGALQDRCHRQLHRPGRAHPDHRDHARVGPGARARRGARRRVERRWTRRTRRRWWRGSRATTREYVTGQVIRVIHDKMFLMQGWTEKKSISSGGKPWDAEQLTSIMATELFGSRHPGMRFEATV